MSDVLVERYKFFLTSQGETGTVLARVGGGFYLLAFGDDPNAHKCIFSVATMSSKEWDFQFYQRSLDRDDGEKELRRCRQVILRQETTRA